jgi:RNA polymerase sigma factor (sigma-70 family)
MSLFERDPFARPGELMQRLYAYVAYRVGDGPDAEDITSDALERALRYRSSYDPRRGEPISWLIGIAKRCIADAAMRVTPAIELGEFAATGDVSESSVRRLELARAVATLGDRDRELIALRFGADLSPRQIGDLLGMRPNAAAVAIHRALGRLREALEVPDVPAVQATL